jgi:hypothetical protein
MQANTGLARGPACGPKPNEISHPKRGVAFVLPKRSVLTEAVWFAKQGQIRLRTKF